MVMPYHLHMPSYFLETFTEYPYGGFPFPHVYRGKFPFPGSREVTLPF